jgi:hypothetical protein
MQLDKQLAAWKDSIVRAGTLTEEDILELEVHVRDTVQELMGKGLTQEEALLVALRRIGDPSVLAVEYQKVNPGLAWARRWYWMTAGFLGFSVALQGVQALPYLIAWLALPEGTLVGGLLIMSLIGYAVIAFGMLQSAKVPAGRIARALQRVATWIERHPAATCVLGFTTLVGLRALAVLAMRSIMGDVERDVGAVAWTLGTLNTLVAVLIPIVLFLLGRYVNPDEDGRIESAR